MRPVQARACDERISTTSRAHKREVTADGGAMLATLVHLWPYIWPADRRDLKPRRSSRRCCCSSPSSPPSRCRSPSNGRPMRWPATAPRRSGRTTVIAWALATPVMMTLAYGGMRILMAAAHAIARRHFRQGGDERGAAAGDAHLRAYAPAFAALSSRAQDRRADARPRTRPQRHRDHRAHGAAAARADHRRSGPDRRACCCSTSTGATSSSSAITVVALYVVHLSRDRMAHQHPPRDERERHRRQRQGDRLAAQLRDGQIFLRRGARGQALRPLDGALRGGERQGLRLACRAQCRAGGDLHARARRGHGAVRLRHRARHQHGRRFRHDQRHDDPALPAAEFHGHGLSRDQAGGDRHRDHVLDAVAQAGDRGPAGRASRCRCSAGAIRFENVSFAYEPARPILKG